MRLIEVFESKSHIYIVMELISGGELFDYLVQKKFLPENETALIIHQLLETLSYIHLVGVIHRDIKPENILIEFDKNSGTINYIKVTDFGLSKLAAPEQDIFDPCGTLSYVGKSYKLTLLAPEVLTKEGYRKEVDVWSTGVVMYLL